MACQDDNFPVYNELEGLRVLGIQADPPAIAPGQAALLSALVFEGDGKLEDVRYAWSWCPARAPVSSGAECLVDGEMLAELGVQELSFDLGTEPTAELEHAVPPGVLEALCSTDADGADGEGLGFLFDCDQGFPVSVQLIATRGEDRIRSIKEVRLRVDDGEPEANPTVVGVAFAEIPQGTDDDDVPEMAAEPIAEDGTTVLTLGKRYRLFADVPDSASERFVRGPEGFEGEPEEKRENLALSWFVSAGETDKPRTAFTDGSSALADIRPNSWSLPRPRDVDRKSAELILVIRDERGGASWLRRTVELSK